MKFSVIIPLYNKAPYIRKALESVFAQTYTDFELIIIDDGSTDDSAAIAEECTRTSSLSGVPDKVHDFVGCSSPLAFRLIKQPNAGVAAARNNGVAQANGDYLAFLDADDWWEPNYLERMAQLIADYPDAGLYASNYMYYKPGKTHVALNIPTGYINYPRAYYESGAMPVWTGATLIPRHVYTEMGGFPIGIKLGEDFLLWAKIAMHYPIALLSEPLAWYNNDVPATMRATRNLHKPEHHMLFRLEVLGDKAMRLEAKGVGYSNDETQATTPYTLHHTPSEADWQSLLDKLRVNGLLEYWMSDEYHDLAAQELAKVDWSKQPASVKRMYKTPIWILKVKRQVMKWGSVVKQCVIRLKVRG